MSRWPVARLGDIASVQLGKMLSPQAVIGGGQLPYLRNQDVQWGRINTAALPTMSFDDREREKFKLLTGDLLLCEGGEPGRAAIWSGQEPIYYQKALHRVRALSGCMVPEYLYRFFVHAAAADLFRVGHTRNTIAHLPRERLSSR